MLDSKAPSLNYRDFIMNEVRYNALERTNSDRAEKLFEVAEKQSRDKYEHLLKLSQFYGNGNKIKQNKSLTNFIIKICQAF